MKRILAASVALLALACGLPGHAQTAQPVALCGSLVLQANGVAMPLSQSPGGQLCTNTASATMTPAQVSVGATATLIAALRSGRNSITVENTGTTAIYLGGSGVTTSTGVLLPGVLGASITLNYSGALYGITTTGSQTVSEYELY